MNRLPALLCVLITTAFAFGQPIPTAEAPANGNTPAAARSGKVVVPPEKLRAITIPKTEISITIDGRLDEEAWSTAAVFKDFYQTSPGDNTAPSRPTEAYVMYDEKHLYIGFKCWDEPDKIRASMAKRDAVFGEDNVRVWLDTYNDQRRAYILGFNPYGIQQDGIYTEGRGADFSVDIVMESKGIIEPWGWSVEVKIPFKSLRYTAGPGKMWGFNVARNIDRFNDEFNMWLPDDRNVSGFLIKHGKITGLDEIKYERTLELIPSITVSQTGRRTRSIPRFILNNPATNPNGDILDPGRFVNFGLKQDIGLNLKYTISPNITLDAAINPDFAEIEADAPVVTANQRFPIFFQEKRPFFLEGNEIFQTVMSIWDSRSIIDPDFAAKVTGKVGKNSFGLLVASDSAPGNFEEDDRNDPSVRPRIDEFLDRNALVAVARVKRDFGAESNVGMFASYRDFAEQKNLVLSVDTRIKLSPTLTTQFQAVGTYGRRCFFDPGFEPLVDPVQAQRNRDICGTGTYNIFGNQTIDQLNRNSTTFNEYRSAGGFGYVANINYYTDKQGFGFDAVGRTRDFRADAGFTRRTNTNSLNAFHRQATANRPQATMIRFSWAQFGGLDHDWSGRTQLARYGQNVVLTFQKSFYVNAEVMVAQEKLYEEEFGLKRTPTRPTGTFFGDPTRSVFRQLYHVNASQNVNKYFNYFGFVRFQNNAFDYFGRRGGLLDPGPGKQLDAELFLEYKPIGAMRISASYRKSRMVRNDNRVRSFDSDIVSLRSTYQFSRFVFTRMRIDYDSTRSSYAGQLLFGWNPSPGTAFYVGYNDNFNYRGYSPYTGQFEPGFERNSRTFFIRASYLFRKSF